MYKVGGREDGLQPLASVLFGKNRWKRNRDWLIWEQDRNPPRIKCCHHDSNDSNIIEWSTLQSTTRLQLLLKKTGNKWKQTWFLGKQRHLVSNEEWAQTLGPCALAPSAGRCRDLYICLGCRNFLAFVFDYLMSLTFSSNAVFYSLCVKSCFILVFKKKLLQTSHIVDMRRITFIQNHH